MIDGKILEKVNYFDENTFLYYEENILAKKIKDISKKEAINNKVTIDKNIKKINKYKILKTSQKYYVHNYLKANKLELLLLCLTNKLSLLILYIRCLIKRK